MVDRDGSLMASSASSRPPRSARPRPRLTVVAAALAAAAGSGSWFAFGGSAFCEARPGASSLPACATRLRAGSTEVLETAQGVQASGAPWVRVGAESPARSLAGGILGDIEAHGMCKLYCIGAAPVNNAVKGITIADFNYHRDGKNPDQALGFWVSIKEDAAGTFETDFLIKLLPAPKPHETSKVRQRPADLRRKFDEVGTPIFSVPGNWSAQDRLCTGMKVALQEHGMVKIQAVGKYQVDKAVDAVRRVANFIRDDIQGLAGIEVPADEPLVAAFPRFFDAREAADGKVALKGLELSIMRLPFTAGTELG